MFVAQKLRNENLLCALVKLIKSKEYGVSLDFLEIHFGVCFSILRSIDLKENETKRNQAKRIPASRNEK